MEDSVKSRSWIDVKKLKEESTVQCLYRNLNDKSDDSIRDHIADVSSEVKPNAIINDTASFRSVHKEYCKQEKLVISIENCEHQNSVKLEQNTQAKDMKNGEILLSYKNCIQEIKNELLEAHSEIDSKNREIEKLKNFIEKLKQEHCLFIESMQAKHEKRHSKRQEELGKILNEIVESQDADLNCISKSHSRELECLRNHYENDIFKLKLAHKQELKSLISENHLTFNSASSHSDISLEETLENSRLSLTSFASTLSNCASTPDFAEKYLKNDESNCKDLGKTLEYYQSTVDILSKELISLIQTFNMLRSTIQTLESSLKSLQASSPLLKSELLSPSISTLRRILIKFS